MTVIIIVISCSSIYKGTVLITLISLMTLSMNQPKVIRDTIGVLGIRIYFSACNYDSHYYRPSHLTVPFTLELFLINYSLMIVFCFKISVMLSLDVIRKDNTDCSMATQLLLKSFERVPCTLELYLTNYSSSIIFDDCFALRL